MASMPWHSSIASRLPKDFSISSSPATLRARSSKASATATNCAFGTRRRRFSAWRRPISPTPKTPTPSFFVIVSLCPVFFCRSLSGGCARFLDCADDALQIGKAFCHRPRRGDRNGVEFYVLFDDHPAGVIVFLQRAEEGREVDISLPDDREDFVFDGFFKGPFIFARFGEDFLIAVLDVDEAEFAFEFFRFFHRVGLGKEGVARVEAETNSCVRSRVEKLFSFFGGFNVSRDVRMEDEIEAEFLRDLFGTGNDFADVLPLFGVQLGASGIVGAAGEGVAARRLIIG